MARHFESASHFSNEPTWVRWLLIASAVFLVGVIVVLPLAAVLVEAAAAGLEAYWSAVTEEDTVSSIKLTLLVALLSVPLNIIFGVATAWAITKFKFPGKNLLLTLIDLPFSVSPVVAGLCFVLLFGLQGFFGPWLQGHGI
ncbi:MAG: sulfate ABC transporter permease subunit CysW, partial [Arenimonas sp.]